MMGTWNYRIVKYQGEESGYGLHEVYYNDKGQPWSMTSEPRGFFGETPDEVVKAIEMALKDAREHPVFKEPAPGKWADNG